MSELLRQAALDAGLMDVDCVKLIPFARDAPADQVARFKATHPQLFYAPPPFDARTAPMAEVKRHFAELQRAEAKRQADAATARTLARLEADRAAADAARDMRATQLRERQAAEHRQLSAQHARQRAR